MKDKHYIKGHEVERDVSILEGLFPQLQRQCIEEVVRTVGNENNRLLIACRFLLKKLDKVKNVKRKLDENNVEEEGLQEMKKMKVLRGLDLNLEDVKSNDEEKNEEIPNENFLEENLVDDSLYFDDLPSFAVDGLEESVADSGTVAFIDLDNPQPSTSKYVPKSVTCISQHRYYYFIIRIPFNTYRFKYCLLYKQII